MIHSMTAFARAHAQGDWGNAVCEIRTINHRYLEVYVKLPEPLHALETAIREHIRKYINRGKVECFLRFQNSEAQGELNINKTVVNNIANAIKELSPHFNNLAPLNALDILEWPGVLSIDETELELIQKPLLDLINKTLKELVAARNREGEELKKFFLQKLHSMNEEVHGLRENISAIMTKQRERLLSRFNEVNIELNTERLEQEMLLLAQKIDVTEELERLETHIAEVERIVKTGGVIGRRLDFLMQELNREANTLGSKSIDVASIKVAVDLKVLIEQLREQVQNIE